LTNLDCPILNYNPKRSNNIELSIVLYELRDENIKNEVEVGFVNLSVSSLVDMFIEKNVQVKLEKKDRLGPYQLQYTVIVDKTKPGVLAGVRIT